MDAEFEKLMNNLTANNMQAFFVETKSEVVPLVSELLHDGDTVAVGGSMSLFECGVMEHLRCGRYNLLDRYESGLIDEELSEIFLKSMSADAYLCSSNAVTESGELYNVDGRANRICAISYGPRSVIMVVGKNKLVTGLNEAVMRVKTTAAPLNCKRLDCNTYCRETGRCISSTDDMTAGCNSPGRICCSYLVTGKQRVKDRIKVILVGEELGY